MILTMPTLCIDDYVIEEFRSSVPQTIMVKCGNEKSRTITVTDVRDRRINSFNSDRPGLFASRLKDWRRIEARMIEIRARYVSASDAYWGVLKALHDRRPDKHIDTMWVINPTSGIDDDQYVLVYENRYSNGNGSTHLDTVKHLVKNEVDSTNPAARATIVTGEQARDIFHLKEREECWARRYYAYVRAFHAAIELRLSVFINENKKVHSVDGWGYVPPTVFAIENDSRKYAINIDQRGQFNWSEFLYEFK